MVEPGREGLWREMEEFIIDRQSRGHAPGTIAYYRRCLRYWADFLGEQGVESVQETTPSHVRRFLVELAQCGHSPGGVATIFTGLRAFLRWYAREWASEGWDPLARVQAPKRPQERLEPLSLDDFQAMLASCSTRTFTGLRDRALLLTLLDTGLRHQELTDLEVADLDLSTGQVVVRQGKGRKGRAVYIGRRTRRALAAYLRQRRRQGLATAGPLWVQRSGERLSKAGIRQVVRRAARRAGVPEPGMHAFRRAFAVNSLRNGMDLVTLQRLMGHADLSTLNRYLALVDEDLRRAQARHGVVDRMG